MPVFVKKGAKMNAFLCENRKNSLAAGDSAPTPSQPPAASGLAPTPQVVLPSLPNPGCATGFNIIPYSSGLVY